MFDTYTEHLNDEATKFDYYREAFGSAVDMVEDPEWDDVVTPEPAEASEPREWDDDDIPF